MGRPWGQEQDLRHLIWVRPFRPLKVRTSDGQAYKIMSPEVMVDETMTVVFDEGKFRFIDNDAIMSLRRLNGRRAAGTAR